MRNSYKSIEQLVCKLNVARGKPAKAWERRAKANSANVGSYEILGCKPGRVWIYTLAELADADGGVNTLYNAPAAEMVAYIEGMMRDLAER